MTLPPATALIADDEPLLREELALLLGQAWPELVVVALARNGREAVSLFEEHTPDICFLDVQMPGLSGIEAARQIGRRAQLVFVTAFDHYALKAFEQRALDYLVKPVDGARLADTVSRLQDRLRGAAPAQASDALLIQLAEQVRKIDAQRLLHWIRASVGDSLRLIAIDDVDFLRSDEKYTLVGFRDDSARPAEALIRTPLRELIPQLDPARFAQVHRSAVVNLRSVSHLTRGENETGEIHLRGRNEKLPVSRKFLPVFRQM